jgi:hypothetical protein
MFRLEAVTMPYTFRYYSESGAMVRLAVILCASKEQAIAQAYTTMREPFTTVEITLDETVIYRSSNPTAGNASKLLRVA